MTMSWHMMVDFNPPLIACIVSDRDHSFAALHATKECVIGIPPFELAEKVVAIGNCSGREVDKFATFRLMPKKALCVSAPLVAECFANIECRIVDTPLSTNTCLFILEGLKAWVDPSKKNPKTIHHQGFDRFVVHGETIELASRTP